MEEAFTRWSRDFGRHNPWFRVKVRVLVGWDAERRRWPAPTTSSCVIVPYFGVFWAGPLPGEALQGPAA